MARVHPAALAALALVAAGCDDGAAIPAECVVYEWTPGAGDLESFPTTDYLTEDPSTPTGYRAGIAEGVDLSVYGPMASLFREQAADLDGIGLQSEMWLGFSGPLDPTLLPVADGAARAGDGAGVVVLPEGGSPYLVPVETRASENYLYIRPLRPLPEATRVAYFASRALTAAAGGCFEPKGFMRRTLRNPDAARAEAIDALVGLGVVAEARELVAIHAVTTQTATHEDRVVAEHIRGLDSAIASSSCTDEGTHRRCDASITVEDYRGDDGAVAIDVDAVRASRTWDVPVSIWLPPASVAGPYPTFLFGHGLTFDRDMAGFVGRDFAEQGWATVSIDAVAHGDHPSTGGERLEGAAALLRFFALDLNSVTFDARRMRGHWRQSAFDKLQVLRAFERSGDLDGDGARDVEMAQLGYFGISLGGIMSVELTALSDAFSIVVTLMGGGTYSRIVFDDDASFYRGVHLVLRRYGDERIAQGFAAMQAVLDRGDATVYGQHVLADRWNPASSVPDYLLQIAIDDDTVTNAASYSLARALGLGIAGSVVDPQVGIPAEASAAPYVGNWAGGRATVGMLQCDVIDDPDEGVIAATHFNLTGSAVARAAWEPFVASHLADGIATLVDPYVAESLPHGLPSP